MKVISQDGAVATLSFIADEAKPVKGYNLPTLIDAIGKRYRAVITPTVEETRSTGAKFQNATFMAGDREIAIPQLAIHRDGIVVTTTDTADSDVVLDDAFEWLKQNFGFREPMTPAIRTYQSDLVIRFDNDPGAAFGGIADFLKFIQGEMTPGNAPSKKDVQFSLIAFGADPIGAGVTPEFTVARRGDVPWRLGLYFSKAHMRTSSHIKALELLDRLLGRR